MGLSELTKIALHVFEVIRTEGETTANVVRKVVDEPLFRSGGFCWQISQRAAKLLC